ncbi:MAG: hypothetical protein WDW36_004856 [Sanguina aurantia]
MPGHVRRCPVSLLLQVALPAEPGTGSGTSAGGLEPPTFKACLRAGVHALQQQLQQEDLVFLAQHAGSSPGRVLLQQSTAGSLSRLLPKSYAGSVALSCKPLVCSTPSSPQGSSGGSAAAPAPAGAPLYTYLAAAGGAVHMASSLLQCDVLCYAPASMALSELGPKVLLPALLQQLTAMEQVLSEHGKVLRVTAHHFLPPGRNHHVTALYPTLHPAADTNEMKLAPLRRRLHDILGLPSDRPMLRVSHALQESALSCCPQTPGTHLPSAPVTARLRDVHRGLPPPGMGGRAQLVEGSYEYCHYTQDRVNDSGWGCAYRSLQTLVSWFRLQGFTQAAIPTHRQVQQILVQLGDKEGEGSEIPGRARELAAHFESQGTPVMIGGGVLAYTLLGVQFDEATGDAAFLILDPHYTGGEDLRKVQQGSWVAWKRMGDTAAAGGPLFLPDAFYNFLCPQRPTEV